MTGPVAVKRKRELDGVRGDSGRECEGGDDVTGAKELHQGIILGKL